MSSTKSPKSSNESTHAGKDVSSRLTHGECALVSKPIRLRGSSIEHERPLYGNFEARKLRACGQRRGRQTANFGLGPEPVTAYMLCGLFRLMFIGTRRSFRPSRDADD